MTISQTDIEHLALRERETTVDIYDVIRLEGEDSQLAFAVVTDRGGGPLAGRDVVIPGKGLDEARLASYWFELLGRLLRHHLVGLATERDKLKDIFAVREALTRLDPELRPRTMVIYKSNPYPVDVIVRGYVTDAAEGTPGEQLVSPDVRFGDGESPEWDIFAHQLGEEYIELTKATALAAYAAAEERAGECGLVLAEARLRFGLQGVPLGEGAQGIRKERLLLAGQPFTPDSALYWESGGSASDLVYGEVAEPNGAPEPEALDRIGAAYRAIAERITAS